MQLFYYTVPQYLILICSTNFCFIMIYLMHIFLMYVHIINPIPAGVLENQHMLGGGQFDPPL